MSAGPGREASLFRVAGASFFTRDTKNCPLSAQQPLDACRRPLHCLDKMIAGIQLKHGVDAVVLVKGPDLLGILPDWFQNRVAGPGLPVPQGEVDAVRPALRLVGKGVFLEIRKPQGAGYTPYTGKQIGLIDGVQGKQPCQRVPGDSAPCRRPARSFSALGKISSTSDRK